MVVKKMVNSIRLNDVVLINCKYKAINSQSKINSVVENAFFLDNDLRKQNCLIDDETLNTLFIDNFPKVKEESKTELMLLKDINFYLDFMVNNQSDKTQGL